MKIDIVKKVGEITITELRSAKENKAVADEAQKLIAEKKRIEEENKRRELLNRLQTLVPHIMELINDKAQRGGTSLDFEWRTSKNYKSNGVTWEEWNVIKKTFNSHLGSLGYSIREHEYSDSWKKQSGRIGYGWISW